MSTFLGIISGLSLMIYSIVKETSLSVFIDAPSVMIVLGGTLAAIFIGFPLPRVLRVGLASLQIFRKDVEKPLWAIAMTVRLAVKARQKSLISLEQDMKTAKNRFLRMGLEMIIDGHPGEIIRDVLETESDFIQIRHRSGAHIFTTLGKLSPAFGLIGTLIGLVIMLQSLGGGGGADSQAKLGRGMAVAMLTTFYGAIMANLFFFPIAEKLRSRSEDESLTTRIVIEGVLMIQAGINPRMIERKLNSFLPPHLRAKHFDRTMKKGKGKESARALDESPGSASESAAPVADGDDF